MQLCEYYESSKYGAARCYELAGGCQGSADNICRPYALWASTLRSASNYEHAWLIDGVLSTAGGTDTFMTFPFGVRCVPDLIPNTDGLQLCDKWESSKYGAAQCYELYGGCQGANGNNCWPNWVWGDTKTGLVDKAYDRALESGSWIINEYTPHEFANAFSVRCVLDLTYDFTEIKQFKYRRFKARAAMTSVLLLALHGVIRFMAAVRAVQTVTATRTTYGLVRRELSGSIPAYAYAKVLFPRFMYVTARVIAPGFLLLVCAVSWI